MLIGRHARRICAGVATATVSVGFTALSTTGQAAADEGPGCTLSDYHAVGASWDTVGGDSYVTRTFLNSEVITVDPADTNYVLRTKPITIKNNATGHTLYGLREMFYLAQPRNWDTMAYLDVVYQGDGLWESVESPTGNWTPRVGAKETIQVVGNTTTSLAEPINPADVSNLVDWSNWVPYADYPAYDLGDLGVGATATADYTVRLTLPQGNGYFYGFGVWDSAIAKTCLPDPTVDSWTSGNGSRTITGTGDYAGDQVELRTAAGALIGTAVVQADLTWSLVPAEPLPVGVTKVIVTETDEFGLTGSSAATPETVVDPAVQVVKLVNGQDVSAAPGPSLVPGDPVTWNYQVTNSGDTRLGDVVLQDVGSDGLNPTVTCPKTALASGESMTCQAFGTVIDGSYTNTATVTGTPELENGDPIDATEPVSASDQSWYRGVAIEPPTPTTTPPASNPPTVTPSATPTGPGSHALPGTGAGISIAVIGTLAGVGIAAAAARRRTKK